MRTRGALALSTLFAGGAILTAPAAVAAPECVDTGPRTTQCETGGSTQIVTTPPDRNYGWPFGWGYGGFLIGF